MGITHSTVVLTADDGTSEVGTDEWNADHAIDTLIIPSTEPVTGADGASLFQVIHDGGTYWHASVIGYGNNNNGANWVFAKTRNAAADGNTIVQSGDLLGSFYYYGSDGTAMRNAAIIKAEVDTTPGSGDMPGRLSFWTTPDGSTTAAERLRIDSAGKVLIGTATSTAGATLAVVAATASSAATGGFEFSQVWNDAAAIIKGFSLNYTNTNSNSSSRLFEIKKDTLDHLYMTADGSMTHVYNTFTCANLAVSGNAIISTSGYLNWSSRSLTIHSEANKVLAIRDGTNDQTLRVYNTYTDSSNYERGVFDWTTTANVLTIGTQKGGTGTNRDVTLLSAQDITIKFAGTTRFCYIQNDNGNRYFMGDTRSGWSGDMNVTWSGASQTADNSATVGVARNANGVLEVNNGTKGTYAAALMATLYRTGYRSVSADITMSAQDSYIIMNKAGSTASVTLTTATAAIAGREIYIKNLGSTAIVSGGASANIVPLAGGATAQAIVAGTAGKYAKLYCDGTTWHIMEAN